jgi:putative lipase involved disintegration of autophagic bodies
VFTLVGNFISQYPDAKIVATGHSMGAALAVIVGL